MPDPQPYESGEDDYVRYAMACARVRAEQHGRQHGGTTQPGSRAMPDTIDQMQDVSDRHVENSLRHHARTLAGRRPGLSHCEQQDCGAPIAPLRQDMGARLCLDCARVDEARSAQHAAWRQR